MFLDRILKKVYIVNVQYTQYFWGYLPRLRAASIHQ